MIGRGGHNQQPTTSATGGHRPLSMLIGISRHHPNGYRTSRSLIGAEISCPSLRIRDPHSTDPPSRAESLLNSWRLPLRHSKVHRHCTGPNSCKSLISVARRRSNFTRALNNLKRNFPRRESTSFRSESLPQTAEKWWWWLPPLLHHRHRIRKCESWNAQELVGTS